MSGFKWTLKEIKVKDIKLNPNNPKIRDPRGFERLRKSLEKFGHIFDGIMNTDYNLIDGHSRIELMNPNDMARVFVPDKKLSKKQYLELNALFDVASAGEPDFEIIMDILGEEGALEWGFEFNNEDTNGEEENNYDYPEDGEQSHVRMVSLFFNDKTEPVFRDYCADLQDKFNLDNITDTVFKAVEMLHKNKIK